ncbi:Reverse transcriptase (RNA-dependent DNA polymerase) [Nesidiocoris tenuis]|uniref:Reverse transcriptase (RNA-dependent DNA polymerase) n=1 Tax=Nesidiocoris tenuis TaxID=355587 RepID=A0ABN7A5L2_9HEMI|nr:Reverse transcriptase (RNA-dependent DNA polymerase) [Nesidiocoris tenuis]
MRGRLEKHVTLEPEQYGFVKGKGTTDALLKIKGAAASLKKCVMLICVDISGAFDNLWWPALLQELRKAEVPANLFRLVKSYLKNRKTVIKEGNGRQETNSTKAPRGQSLARTSGM